nr:HD domain-containing protein [Lachnospiraceae bacterium]
LLIDSNIKQMGSFEQHEGNDTLQHVVNVAWNSFYLAEKFHIKVDYEALAKGAILHDFYLYDIKESGLSDYRHGVSHPGTALSNAEKLFTLSEKEKNIILSHMWPLTLFHMPKSKEAWLVCLADKYCAFNEMILHKMNLVQEEYV